MGEKRLLFHIRFKDYNSSLIIWETKEEVEVHCTILDIGDRAKMSALLQVTPTFNAT